MSTHNLKIVAAISVDFVQVKIKMTDYIRFQDCKQHELS